MADKIHSYYTKAEKIGGMEARAKLSMLTSVNSHQAKAMPDSEDTIKVFERAMEKLVKEFNANKEENSIRLKLFKLMLFQ
jgi:hypothetical protein